MIAEATSYNRSFIGHLKRQRDRMAIARYELGRDFAFHGNNPSCGNILMFENPDGTPPLEPEETVFAAFDWLGVMDDLFKHQGTSMTVLEAAEAYALSSMEKVAAWATSGDVVAEFICAPVETVIPEIAKRKPATMSWSNLCDYMDISEFHSMARRCSLHGDTVHFGSSMNWNRDVAGLDTIDVGKAETRAAIIDGANEFVVKLYQMLGWGEYLLSPPPSNPSITSALLMEQLHYMKWCDFFFEQARRRGPCQVGTVEHMFLSPLSEGGRSTIAFFWTYDKNVNRTICQPSDSRKLFPAPSWLCK
jgi:hypothetical protein